MIATLITGSDLPGLGGDDGADPLSMDVPTMKAGERPKADGVPLEAAPGAVATGVKRLSDLAQGKKLKAPATTGSGSPAADVPKKAVKTCADAKRGDLVLDLQATGKVCNNSEVAQSVEPGDAPLFKPAANSKADPMPKAKKAEPTESPEEPLATATPPAGTVPEAPETDETPTTPAPTSTTPSAKPENGVADQSLSSPGGSARVQPAGFKQTPPDGGPGLYFSPNWVQAPSMAAPTAPTGAASAYDKVNHQIVLFGGRQGTADTSDETWLWNGNAWAKQTPTTKPPGRLYHSMAWSPEYNAVIMFGGQRVVGGVNTLLNDLWKWDGTNWVQLTPTGTAPTPRAVASLAWSGNGPGDPNGMILFGGTSGTLQKETWLLKNNAWTRLNDNNVASGVPAARQAASMAYNESAGQIVLFGGLSGTCAGANCNIFSDTWVFDQGSWSQKTPTYTPPGRAGASMAYDPGIGGTVMFGGLTANTTTVTYKNDTWAWNGQTWLQATGLASPPSAALGAIAASDTGQVVMFGTFGFAAGKTWTYDTNLPVLSIDLSGATTGNTTPEPTFYSGDSVTVKIKATNTGINPIAGNTRADILSPLDGNLLATGSQLHLGTQLLGPCATGATTVCGLVNSLVPSFFNLTIPPGLTDIPVVNYVATVVGLTRGCSIIDVPALAKSIFGSGATVTAPMTVCGGGLGTEDWWTYDTTDIGNGGSANVNVANGNLVVKQTDSTPIQNHGDLAFSLGRVYNSQENMNSGGPLGAGWQFDIGETGESAGSGFGIAGLKLPSLQSLTQPLSMTYVDRDGTRHVFSLRSLAATVGDVSLPIDLSGGAESAGKSILDLLNPDTLPFNAHPKESDHLPYSGLCIDQAYKAPPGTDMYLFRYIGVGTSGCSNAADPQLATLGWSLVRPDRVRYDFNIAGQLIRTTDAAGNVMVYKPDTPVRQYGPTEIYSQKCPPTDGTACPRYTIDYNAGGPVAAGNRHVKVTDPAGRVTSYVVGGDLLIPQLLQVWDPGNPISDAPGATPSAAYTYSVAGHPCDDSAPGATTIGAMCSVVDAKGKKTTFTYTPATFTDHAPIGADRVLAVTDRRGNESGGSTKGLRTQYAYNFSTSLLTEDAVTADMAAPATFGPGAPATGCNNNAACQRNYYRSIDDRGRIGEIDQGSANDRYVKQTGYFWDGNPWVPDGPPGTCRQPDNVVDNNLCQVITRAVPRDERFVLNDVKTGTIDGVTVADQGVGFTYGDMGQLLRKVQVTDPAGGWSNANASITTYGTHDQYFDADGKQRSFDNSVTGSGNVQSTAGSANYAPVVKGDNPIAYYRLGEKTGTTMVDDSSDTHPNNATYGGGVQLGQPGAVPGNSAVGEPLNAWTGAISSLQGFASGTSAPDSDFTVETWVKSSSTAAEYALNYGTNGNKQMYLGRYTGGLPWVVLGSNIGGGKYISVLGNTSISDGQYHHVVYTYDGSGHASGLKIYVDGQPTALTVYSDTLDGPFAEPGSYMALGQAGANPSYLDEVALYSKALPQDRIDAHRRAAYGTTRVQAGTLYGVTDQTQVLSPRGNAPGAAWGDYLTTMRLDVPDDGKVASANKTTGDSVCGDSPRGNTGLVCEVDTPASAGVDDGDCRLPSTNLAPGSPSAPTTSGYTNTCTTYTYDAQGQRITMTSPKAHETGSSDKTTYTYYQDVGTCSTSGEAPKALNCDLTRSVSAGGWLKAVTDPNGKSVVYAYDRAGNVARTWDRNATNGKSLNADWTNAANPPSTKYAENNFATPVTSAALSTSYAGTVVVRPDGTVAGSGNNASGELGTGSTAPQSTPATAKLLTNIVQVAQTGNGAFAACKITFALTGDGDVYKTGGGASTPAKIGGLSNITSIAAGGCGLLALDNEGKVWGWGDNSSGQIGNGSAGGTVTTPVQVLTGVAAIGAGSGHSLAVKTDGSVWTWGANAYGQLGLGDTSAHTNPTKVPSFSRAAAVSAGVATSYVIKRDGSVWSFGENSLGALGTGSSAASATTPQKITSLGEGTSAGLVREVVGVAFGAAALMTDGRVRVWGYNNAGQLGGATTDAASTSPVLVPGVSGQVAIAGGWATYLTADRAGTTTIWGDTSSNQRGDGTSPPVTVPAASGHTISPYDVPWRYARGSRDPVGNLTTQVTNSAGEQRLSRPARGNAINTSAFDVTATYDADGNPLSSMTPMEREGAKKSLTAYDPFGNVIQTVDPRGNATVTQYDTVNRAVAVRTTRSTTDNSESSGCTDTAAAGGLWSAQQIGHKVCVLSSTYDGADQTITTTDQNSQTTKVAYDGAGRAVKQTAPRNDGTYTTLSTMWNYDRDGNVTDVCPPRQFDSAHEENTTTGCTSTGAYSTHSTYDRAGRAASQKRYRSTGPSSATAVTSTVSFDADGNAIKVVDANDHDTTFTYDLQGRRLTQSAPRSDTKRYSTKWKYDAAGNVTSIQAPGSLNIGSGRDGRLVVDGTTAANSTDGAIHDRAHPFLIPDGAQYRSVKLTGGGWIKSASPVGLMFSATEDVTVCATCGIDQKGTGYDGGAGGNEGLGSAPGANAQNPNVDPTNGNGGLGGAGGLSSILRAHGGGGGGHNGPGLPGVPTGDVSNKGGAASGTADFTDVGTDYLAGSGGGGGGGGQGLILLDPAGGNGGDGGGYVRITATTITVDGQVDASGANGGDVAHNAAGGGGGAGGGIWLAAPDINLASTDVLNVTGGAGGNSDSGYEGGDGAPGYVRIDADSVSNPPANANRTRAANITSYSYDANNRVVDTLAGAQTLNADPAVDSSSRAIPDAQGLFNTRSRNVYDPEGRVVSVLPPQAFTNAASLTDPKTDTAGRTDFDLDGRAVASYDPRYNSSVDDKGTGNDGGTGVNQQTAQCPTGAKPQTVEGLGSYSSDVGVCVTRTKYDENGNVAVAYLPTSDGGDNRRMEYTYTDDNLVMSVTAPDPSGSGRVTAGRTFYDGVGRTIKSLEAEVAGKSKTTVAAYTSDGLPKWKNVQGYSIDSTSVTHVTTMSYDADGQQITTVAPRGVAVDSNGLPSSTNPDYATTTTWTSDGLTAAIKAPGTLAGAFNTTNYTYDQVGNPLTVKSPEQVAAGGSGKSSVNTFTWDNMIATSSNPIDGSSYRTTRYAYTPSAQKSAVEIARCTSSDPGDCTPSNSAWHHGGTTRYTYAPNGLNVDQIGKDNTSITKEYDQAGRVKKVTDPTSDITISATYYLDGLLRTVADNKNSNTYAYDARGEVSARSDETPSGGVTDGAVKRTTYAYNDAGLPSKMTSGVNSGNTTSMSYDAAGRLTQSTDSGGTGQTNNYSYHPDNALAAAETKVSGSSVSKFEYRYDNNGNIKKQTVTGSAPSYTNTYGYNPANNVTSYVRTGTGPVSVGYTWDRNANRVKSVTEANGPTPASTITWSYRRDNSIETQTTTASPNRSYSYDNAGLLTDDDCSNYTYDDFDRIHSVDNAGALSGCFTGEAVNAKTTYTYDGLDRQRTAVVTGSGTLGANATTKTVYDGLSATIVGQIDAVNGTRSTPDVLYQLGPDGSHVAMQQTGNGAATSYLNDDGQGNISTQITTGGNTACAAAYDPFGSPANPSSAGDSNDVCATGGTAVSTTGNANWYRDQVRDGSTGNYQLGTRTYNPSTASFTSPDNYRVSDAGTDLSVGVDPLTANNYTYVNGNPVNAYDPTGHRVDCGSSNCNGDVQPNGRPFTKAQEAGRADWNVSQLGSGFWPEVPDKKPGRLSRLGSAIKNGAGGWLVGTVGQGFTMTADCTYVGGGLGVKCSPTIKFGMTDEEKSGIYDTLDVSQNSKATKACEWGLCSGAAGLVTAGGKIGLKATERAAVKSLEETATKQTEKTVTKTTTETIESATGKAARKSKPKVVAHGGTSDVKVGRSTGATTAHKVEEAFHHTDAKWLDSMMANGLRPGTYATPQGGLSPLQASLELALPPNRALPNATVRIDVAGLRDAGFEIPGVSRVSGTVTDAHGRVYNMPGGGTEMNFPYAIPSEFLKVVR